MDSLAIAQCISSYVLYVCMYIMYVLVNDLYITFCPTCSICTFMYARKQCTYVLYSTLINNNILYVLLIHMYVCMCD